MNEDTARVRGEGPETADGQRTVTLNRVLDLLADEYVIAKTPTARKHLANVAEALLGSMPQRGRRAVPDYIDEGLRGRAERRKQRLVAAMTKGEA